MAFKLRSPLHTDNPYRAKSAKIVASHAKAVAGYKPGSKANPTYGTAKNLKEADLKEKGKRTNLPSEKQKPTKKAKSTYPASQGGSPMAYRGSGKYKSANTNIKAADLMGQGPVAKGFRAIAGIDTPESSSFPSKITSTTGGASNLDFSKGDIIGQYGKSKSRPSTTSKPGGGIMVKDANKNNAERIKNKSSVKPKSNTSTKVKPAAKPISSSDSGDRSGGYLKNTKNFSLGVDTNMGGNISKVQNVVSKARDAGHNLISGGAMSKRDRIRNRQGIRTENKRTRVGQQIERIKGRQQRAGISKDKGANPGYSTEQKKLDAFEKAMDSPKAAKPSMKLKPTMSKTQTLTDSQLNKKLNKPAIKKKTTGKTKSLSMTRSENQKSLTDLAMTGKK